MATDKLVEIDHVKDFISRDKINEAFDSIWDCADMVFEPDDHCCAADDCGHCKWLQTKNAIKKKLDHIPAADVRPLTLDTPYIEDAIEAVIEERRRQISLYGDQSNLLLLSWPGILGEEFGELCEAFGETVSPPPSRRHPERGGLDNIFREACHVAAVAVQIMEIMKKIRAEEMED